MSQGKIRLALVGYGKMGREIERLVKTDYQESFDIVSIIDPELSGNYYREINKESVGQADVCIDFTRPDVVVDNTKKLVNLEKKIVVGTTGWYDRRAEVVDFVADASGILVYSPNFSFGVNAFLRAIKEGAKVLGLSPEFYYDLRETHHEEKKDKPSGTAKKMAQSLRDAGIRLSD